jgi:hypothetical protein
VTAELIIATVAAAVAATAAVAAVVAITVVAAIALRGALLFVLPLVHLAVGVCLQVFILNTLEGRVWPLTMDSAVYPPYERTNEQQSNS